MDLLAPAGPVYQAGTLAGNPLATAAGLSVLRRLRDSAVYVELERQAAVLEECLGAFGRVQRVGALLTLFMTDRPVRNFEDAQRCDTERYGALFRHLLEEGVYFPPSQFEALFPSTAHGEDEIERTVVSLESFAR
jgi:glutamate-1-semialdehyde 2,1-aminomutase